MRGTTATVLFCAQREPLSFRRQGHVLSSTAQAPLKPCSTGFPRRLRPSSTCSFTATAINWSQSELLRSTAFIFPSGGADHGRVFLQPACPCRRIVTRTDCPSPGSAALPNGLTSLS